MALRQELVTFDDIDGSPGASRYTFTWRSVTYEIDLTEEHASQIDEALEAFIQHARTGRKRDRAPELVMPDGIIHATPAPPQPPAAKQYPLSAAKIHARREMIRQWAKAEGLPVSDRGNLSTWVIGQYEHAHPEDVEPGAHTE